MSEIASLTTTSSTDGIRVGNVSVPYPGPIVRLPQLPALPPIPTIDGVPNLPPFAGAMSIDGVSADSLFDGLGFDESFAAGDTDVVGIFDADFTQIFVSARPMKLQVSETSKPMEHPVESGGVVTDWRVVNPVDISVTVYATGDEYPSVYREIKDAYLSNSLYSVLTKSGLYENMMFVAIPHEETPDQFDMLALNLQFREAILVDAQFQALPASQAGPTDQSTIDRGEQQGSAAFMLFKGMFK